MKIKKKISVFQFSAIGVALSLYASSALSQEQIKTYSDYDIPEIVKQAPKQSTYHGKDLSSIIIGGEAGIGYIDNIFRSPTNEESDVLFLFNPEAEFIINGEQHDVRVKGDIEVGRHKSKDENDYVDLRLRARDEITINENLSFTAKGELRKDHVGIGAQDDEPDRQSSETTEYIYGNIGGFFDVISGKYKHNIGANASTYDYENTTRVDGTQNINDDRDRNEYVIHAESGFFATPEIFPYIKGKFNQRKYDERIDSSALFERDSSGYLLAAGSRYESLDSTLSADGYIGALKQNYDASALNDISALALGGEVKFQLSPETNIRTNLDRRIRETTLTDASGYLQSRIKAAVEHQYDAANLVFASARYTINDFEVNNINGQPNREDKIVDFTIGFEHALSENYVLGTSYTHLNKDSDSANANYSSNQIFLTFSIKN